MEFIIKDGTGKGNKVKVDADNNLRTKGIFETEQQAQALKGKSFQIGTGVANLTSGNESAVILFRNNEDSDVLLTGVNITSKNFTGSTDEVVLAKVYLQGDSLSAGVASAALNNNFGSSIELQADVEVGGEAQTVVNGITSGVFFIPINGFFSTDIAWVIPKGTTIALSYTPGSGNTSWLVTTTLEATLIEKD